jgi:hypothetical protein
VRQGVAGAEEGLGAVQLGERGAAAPARELLVSGYPRVRIIAVEPTDVKRAALLHSAVERGRRGQVQAVGQREEQQQQQQPNAGPY